MTHPLVDQLRFARSEFQRSFRALPAEDAQKRLLPMNCISWNIGHLAWQEQRYFLIFAQDKILLPNIQEEFRYGAPATTPSLASVKKAWKAITQEADEWLDRVTTKTLLTAFHHPSGGTTSYGNLMQRVIYHYFYHTGENMAIRQILQHKKLAEYVGNIDTDAPYRAK